jgi:hypothetical protein
MDELLFELPVLANHTNLTKRKMLSFVASVFDPAGWISPVLLLTKQAQADVWSKSKGKWDDVIPAKEVSTFLKRIRKWEGAQIRFPRKALTISMHSEGQSQLHAFGDASKTGLGLTVYIRHHSSAGIDTALLFARSLIVPSALKPKPKKDGSTRLLTIPRLKLQALRLAAKAVKQIEEHIHIPIESVQLWSDSTIVIGWLRHYPEKEIFIRNRLDNIKSYRVRHVESETNPADIASRGATILELHEKKIWFQGPEFLRRNVEHWPVPELDYDPEKIETYLKAEVEGYSITCSTTVCNRV